MNHADRGQMDHQPDAALIVLAGGSGSRMAASMDVDDDNFNKVYLSLRGRDILEYCLSTAGSCQTLTRIVLVVRQGDENYAAEMLTRLNLGVAVRVTLGGSTRQESEYAGLCELRHDITSGEISTVSIHDGARPFMSRNLLETTINVARQFGGAIPGLPLDEDLYRITSNVTTDLVQPLPTATLRRVQTPQTFTAGALLDAYDKASATGFQGVDTAETVEQFTDLEVRVVPGDRQNIKVTFAEDMSVAEEHAKNWFPAPKATGKTDRQI